MRDSTGQSSVRQNSIDQSPALRHASAGIFAFLLPLGLACASPPDQEADTGQADVAEAALPDTLRIRVPALHTEGVEYEATGGRFLVGSATMGTITEIGDDGVHGPFIEDEDLVGSIGIHIDAANGRLLVANSDLIAALDPTLPGQAKLGVYDLTSGDRLHMVDLGSLRSDGRPVLRD